MLHPYTDTVLRSIFEVFYYFNGHPYPVRITYPELASIDEIFFSLFVEDQFPSGVDGKEKDLPPIRASLALTPLFLKAIEEVKRQVQNPINYYRVIVPQQYRRFPAFIVAGGPGRSLYGRAICWVRDFHFSCFDEAAVGEFFAGLYRRMLDFMMGCERKAKQRMVEGGAPKEFHPRTGHSHIELIIDHLDRVLERPELYGGLPVRFADGVQMSGAELFDALFMRDRVPKGMIVDDADSARAQIALDALLSRAQEEVGQLIDRRRRKYAAVIPYRYDCDDVPILAFGESPQDIYEARMLCSIAGFQFAWVNRYFVESVLANIYQRIYDFVCYAEGLDDFESAVARAMEGV